MQYVFLESVYIILLPVNINFNVSLKRCLMLFKVVIILGTEYYLIFLVVILRKIKNMFRSD